MNNNVFPMEPDDGNQCNEAQEDQCMLRRSNANEDASLVYKPSNLAYVNIASSDKSQPPVSINDVSPKACSSFHSQGRSSLFLEGISMVGEDMSSQSQADVRYDELDNVESSLASIIPGSSSECKSCTLINHEVCAASMTKNEFSSCNSKIDGLYQGTRSGTDCEKPSDNGSKGNLLDDPFERDSSMLDATKGQGHQVQPQAAPVGNNSESDVALDDVKVCDICGDAGREDLLAICSRCSDGAQHTYCMREMLDKVPEANWLCEDCEVMEMENQNEDRCEGVSGRLKSTRLKESCQNSMMNLLLKELPKLDTRTDLDATGSIKELQSPHKSITRQVDHMDVGKASELIGASIATSSPRKPIFSHQISPKNQDLGKGQMADTEIPFQVQSGKSFEVFSRPKAYLSSSSFKGQPPLHSPRGLLGSNEGKKLMSYSSKSFGSSIGNFGAGNPKGSKVTKDGIVTSISAVDGPHNKNKIVSQHRVVQPLELGRKNDGMRDSTNFTSSRQSPLGGSGSLCCQRCSDTGHATQHCPIHMLQGSAHKLLGEQNSTEVVKQGNKWRGAVDAAMSKSTALNGEKSDILEELSAASTDIICEAALKYPSASLRSSSPVQRNASKGTSEDSDVDPTKTLAATDSMQPPGLPLEASYKADCLSDNPTVTKLSVKPFTRTLQVEAPLLANQSTSAIPKLDCIWQGSFSVLGLGSLAETFDGIQAHVSTCASYRVFQVASKVPGQVQLEEVSHISSWPFHFQGVDPQDENIALFFFAKDIDSYEKSYKKLMDKMLRDDLALRGNINGTELLIFTSNKLPVNSQRWNRAWYLWGMFRGKSKYCLPVMGDQKHSVSNLNVELLNQDFPRSPIAEVSSVQNSQTSLIMKKLSESTSCKGVSVQLTKGVDLLPKATDIDAKACRTLEDSHIQKSFNQVVYDCKIPQEQPSFPVGNSSGIADEPLRTVGTVKLKLQMSTSMSCSEEKIIGTCQKVIDSDCTNTKACESAVIVCNIDDESSFRRTSSVPSVSPNCNQGAGAEYSSIGVKVGDKEASPSVVLEEDLLSCDSRANRKRRRTSCSADGLLQPSCEMSKNIIETSQLVEKPSWLPIEDERDRKKACFSTTSSTITDDNVSSSKVHSSIFSQQQQGKGMCSVSVTPENSRNAEWCLFSMDLSRLQKNTSTNAIHMPPSDLSKNTQDSSTLNLELALGGVSKTTKSTTSPLLLHSVAGVRQHMRHGSSGDGRDDASTSLSLSLDHPASSERERSARGILKTEQG